MKQVKKLLVILPLVALFVLGNLPVFAEDSAIVKRAKETKTQADALVKDVITSEDGAGLKEGVKWAKTAELNPLTTAIKALDTALKATPPVDTTVSTAEVALIQAIQTFTAAGNPHEVKTAKVEKQLVMEYYADASCSTPHPTEKNRSYTLPADFFKKGGNGSLGDTYEDVTLLAERLIGFIRQQQQNGYWFDRASVNTAAQELLRNAQSATVKLYAPQPEESRRRRVIAYDIHRDRMAFDQISEVELKEDYESTVGIIEAFYSHSEIRRGYILVGYMVNGGDPVITAPIASLERININKLRDTMNSQFVMAGYAALVVPNTIEVPVEHIFPEGTRATLEERVNVPYETWVTLQNTWRLVDIPNIFKTRIQKINEEGYAFKSMEYYNGLTKITGLVARWDWARREFDGDVNEDFVARVYYDRAVAAAKEVPSEKKVDAATAPQAQIQAPAAQAPVAAANVATTTAPTNTLPVTGASDSIFLFLSSAALMAVGILFFKKH